MNILKILRKILFIVILTMVVSINSVFASERNVKYIEELPNILAKYSGHWVVEENNKFGVYSYDKEEIIPPMYDKFLFRVSQNGVCYYYFVQGKNIVVVNEKNKKIGSFVYPYEKVHMINPHLCMVKLEKKRKYHFYNPKTNKISNDVYDDFRMQCGKSMIFKRNETYLQCKKNGIYFNEDKSVTPVRILLLPIELPIALIHDAGEAVLVVCSIGLWAVFNGTDWWLTGKGSQGLP